MTITRYNPNPKLVAPSTELRMVEDAQGEFVRIDDMLQMSREQLDDLLLELLLYKRAGRDGRIIAGHATESMTRNYQRDHADVAWSDAVPDLDISGMM